MAEGVDMSEQSSEQQINDDELEAATGGAGSMNSTVITYADTFVPFDSSF